MPDIAISISYNEYDIELNRLINIVKKSNNEKFKNSVDFDYILKLFCENYNFDLTDSYFIIINSTYSEYLFFLSVTLIFLQISRLNRFLSYQKQKYIGKDNFYDLLEYQAYGIIKSYAKDDVLDRIMQWAEKTRTEQQENKQKALKIKKRKVITKINFVWKKQTSVLKDLSQKLFEQEYIKRKTDFKMVFERQKTIIWKREIDLLIYLIYKLHEKECFSTNKGKGYLITLPKYFKSKFSRKLAKKNYASDRLQKIRKAKIGNAIQVREKVENLLKELGI